MSAAPTFSVIVACKNPGARLHAALASVWAQRGAAFELIVVDGASTDGTREWLETQRLRLATLVSEPDTGVYAAMNKGLAAARGDWVYFLGADDRLASGDVLGHVASRLGAATDDIAVVAGEVRYEDGRGYRFAGVHTAVRRNFVHHQAAFYRRTVLQAGGGFDPALRIMGDYDVNLRLLHAGGRFLAVPVQVARCGAGGLSDAGGWAGYREEIVVRRRHFPLGRTWLWDLAAVGRYVRKRALRAAASK